MNTVVCPHCNAANNAGAGFCASCGKALPAASPISPRVITGDVMASTSAGMKLQTDELQKTAKSASGALMAVAIIQTVVGGLLLVLFMNIPVGRRPPVNLAIMFVPVLGVGAIFWALYFWSRSNPLPAAIVGLVIYVTVWVLDIVATLVTIANEPSGAGGPGTRSPTSSLSSGIFIRIIIIAMLARAISAGAKHRKLLRQQAAAAAPIAPLPV